MKGGREVERESWSEGGAVVEERERENEGGRTQA